MYGEGRWLATFQTFECASAELIISKCWVQTPTMRMTNMFMPRANAFLNTLYRWTSAGKTAAAPALPVRFTTRNPFKEVSTAISAQLLMIQRWTMDGAKAIPFSFYITSRKPFTRHIGKLTERFEETKGGMPIGSFSIHTTWVKHFNFSKYALNFSGHQHIMNFPKYLTV